MTAYADAIQQKLMSLARERDFARVVHEVVRVGAPRHVLSPQLVKPKTCLAWPESQVFGEPELRRRDGRQRERQTWTWRLQLQFDSAVSLEEFEEALLADVPVIPRSATIPSQVTLRLEDAEYQTPVTQQPSQGTRVTYRFTADLTPN